MPGSNLESLVIPPQIAALLHGGRKIEAIKQLIAANRGLSLRAAKEAVEEYERRLDSGAAMAAQTLAMDQADTGSLPEAARQALMAGDRIEAIKIVRAAYGLDLRSALQRVDDYARGGAPAPDRKGPGRESPARAKPSGSDSQRRGDDNVRIVLIAFVIAVVVVAVGYWVLG